MKIKLDKYTEEQAREYADNESEIKGFKIGSEPWKKAFKEYLSFAYSTMSVGRNPRRGSKAYKTMLEVYPDIFSESGYAGKAAKNFYTQSGERGVSIESIQDRILSGVNNLVRLHENSIVGTKNTTRGSKQGKIPNEDMSELQFPDKADFKTEDEYHAVVKDVFHHWFQRDLITNAILESLNMFFTLTKSDIETIIGTLNIEGEIEQIKHEGRAEFIKRLRASFKNKIPNYKKTILG